MPGVEVVGPVDDIRPLVAQTSVVVVPLPIARGIQNKILEAMAMGKAVVGSRAALAGISAQAGPEIVDADSPAEWITKIAGLWADAGKRCEIGRQARRFVESRHDWKQCLAPLTEIYDRLPRRQLTATFEQPGLEHKGPLAVAPTCCR